MILSRPVLLGASHLLRAGVVLAALCILPSGRTAAQTDYDSEIDTQRRQLEEMRVLAEEKRQKAKEFSQQEKGVMARLVRAEEALSATRNYIRRLEQHEEALAAEIKKTGVELSWARDELADRRSELARRLRYSYMYSRARALEVVFSAATFPEILQRTAFLNRVLEQDRKLIAVVIERQQAVQSKLAKLEAQREELKRLQREKVAEEAQYKRLKAERERDLAQVREQKEAHQKAAEELEVAAERMERVLAELERKRYNAMRENNVVLAELDRLNFGKNKGRLPWPVEGEVITFFGRQEHPKYRTVTMNNGIDIRSAPGKEVRSVGDGVVDLVQWLPGYGQTVIVNHGRGYYSIYGHLASVSALSGDRVAPGHVVGTVGDTGSLKGHCLHFEVRHGGTAEDPLHWLRR